MNTDKRRSVLIKLGLLLGSGLVVFAIGEVLTRVLYHDTMTLFPRYHRSATHGDFTLRTIGPNSTFWHTSPDGSWEFRTNSQGYEVRQEFTYAAVIEKHLRLHDWNAEFVNAAISGFSMAEALMFLENERIRYQPDAVVPGFFANDYRDDMNAGIFRRQENGELLIEKYEHTPGVRLQDFIYSVPLVPWLSENSYFYSAAFNAAWLAGKKALAQDTAELVVEYAIATDDPVTDYGHELTSALPARLHRYCHERGIPLILIDIPETATESIDPSLDPKILSNISQYANAIVSNVDPLTPYAGVTEIHRPPGQVHISEFTHAILGVTAAVEVERLLAPVQ